MIKQTNRRIALAEDDIDDQVLFNLALKQVHKDAVLVTFNDGQDLMDTLSEEGAPLPDVIFLDLNMPKMNGIKCLEKIRSHNKMKDIPVVILTTSVKQEDIKKAYENKACLFFHKPDKLPKLVTIIQKALSMDLKPWNPIMF